MADPTFFARGHTPTPSDTRWFLLQRILGSLNDLALSAAMHGNGSPLNVVTPTHSEIWYRDDLNDTYWWATGPTSADWTQVV